MNSGGVRCKAIVWPKQMGTFICKQIRNRNPTVARAKSQLGTKGALWVDWTNVLKETKLACEKGKNHPTN